MEKAFQDASELDEFKKVVRMVITFIMSIVLICHSTCSG